MVGATKHRTGSDTGQTSASWSGLILTWSHFFLLTNGCSLWLDASPSSSQISRKLDNVLQTQRETDNLQGNLHPDRLGHISTPPAKKIRLDGKEASLETAPAIRLAEGEFWSRLHSLLSDQKNLSATILVRRYPEVAESHMWQRWASPHDTSVTRFVAELLSRGDTGLATWQNMLVAARADPLAATRYQKARQQFTRSLESSTLTEKQVNALSSAAEGVSCPMVRIDMLRLLSTNAMAQGQGAWAESMLLQAIELAQQHQAQTQLADLWLMLATQLKQSGDERRAEEAWSNGVDVQTQAEDSSEQFLNAPFWLRADRAKPTDATWPKSARDTLAPFAVSVGCSFAADSPTELIIWTAVGHVYLEASQPQLALLHFKRAENSANGENIWWLRIAQSHCLAAMGQVHAAATLLGGPLASTNPTIVAAANAALGSMRLRGGAFQLGAQLLGRALADATQQWPGRVKAEADFALAHLITGETAEGLRLLHAAQRRFEIQGDHGALLQSLENELKLLQHEGKQEPIEVVRHRMDELERMQPNGMLGGGMKQ